MKEPGKTALLVLAGRLKKSADEAPAKAEEESEGEAGAEAEKAAFGELRAALAAEDDAKGAEALKRFLEACGVYRNDAEEKAETAA